MQREERQGPVLRGCLRRAASAGEEARALAADYTDTLLVAPFSLDIPPHVAEVLRHLPPDIKRPVKAALRAIGANPSIGAPLERQLKGLWRFRVRRFRIAYAVDRSRRTIRVMAVVHRRHVYDDLAHIVRPDRDPLVSS